MTLARVNIEKQFNLFTQRNTIRIEKKANICTIRDGNYNVHYDRSWAYVYAYERVTFAPKEKRK